MSIHFILYLASGTLCDHWSGHKDALKTGPILCKNFFSQRVMALPEGRPTSGLHLISNRAGVGWPRIEENILRGGVKYIVNKIRWKQLGFVSDHIEALTLIVFNKMNFHVALFSMETTPGEATNTVVYF